MTTLYHLIRISEAFGINHFNEPALRSVGWLTEII